MARVIETTSGKDVLERIKWKELIAIYLQSVFFNFFIACKNILLAFRRYLDSKFAPTRQQIAQKFPAALSLIGSGEAKQPKHQQSKACPHQLTDAQWGSHKYMKLKVRRLAGQLNSSRTLICDVPNSYRSSVVAFH